MSPKDIIEELRRAPRGTDAMRLRIAAEERLTPRELVFVAESRLTWRLRRWVAELMAMGSYGSDAAQAYERSIVAADVEHFRDYRVPREGKTLLIALTGGARRLMMPLPSVLQYLPSSEYDVVLLKDRSDNLYDQGIAGYADGLMALAARLTFDFAPAAYRRCITYGASAGGFAALRLGILLRAPRAISVGGRTTWHVRRLLERRPQEAFDLLCACVSPSPPRLICVYGDRSQSDRHSAETLFATGRGEAMSIAGVSNHNVIHELWKMGRLKEFYRDVLGDSG